MPPIHFLTFPSLDRVFYFTAYSATDAEESSGDGVGDLIYKCLNWHSSSSAHFWLHTQCKFSDMALG